MFGGTGTDASYRYGGRSSASFKSIVLVLVEVSVNIEPLKPKLRALNLPSSVVIA